MHKLYIILFFLAAFAGILPAHAQLNESMLYPVLVKQGSIMIGGNGGMSYRSFNNSYPPNPNKQHAVFSEEGRIFRANLTAKGGYFVLPDFAVGAQLGFSHFNKRVKQSNDSIPDSLHSTLLDVRRTVLLVGPFARYYFLNSLFDDDGSFFAEAALGVGLDNIARGIKSDLLEVSAGIGYAYFFNERISIEPMVGFSYNKINISDEGGSYDQKEWGPFFSIGIQAYLYRDRFIPTNKKN